jgi:GT2 family glycosyltransferase
MTPDTLLKANRFAKGATCLAERLRVDGRFLARGDKRVWLRGVTYGPFAPDSHGNHFPPRRAVLLDLSQMSHVGFNALRTYHVPPPWLLEIAGKSQMGVMMDIPWSKHRCFLDDLQAMREARQAVRQAATLGRDYPCVLAYSICNEVAPDVIRWHGARRVEKFLAELMDVSKQADPNGLVTFANYPPAEYLDLSFLDFATFNVYLHDPETFRRYLCRLQNIVGDRPLVLGEIGMDTLRHGELVQADFLTNHLRESMLRGLAGAFVFSWTDEWHTGNHSITDWAFGVVDRNREPKAACHAIRDVFEQSLSDLLPTRPKVSVVVCSYNGGRTLARCLESLMTLNYPDYEVIVVDDGSTDDTCEIVARFPRVRAIHQMNQGLSVARNVGLQAATGSIIAYTDSDCFVDPDWLGLLVAQLEHSDAAAVGGPNLAPDDGWLAACVSASPGQPTHVLESDQVAEHIPGCNMAFRRAALEALNGFDPQFRKAGDDVDLCWRLQQAGMWISFAPGAFVWHHRRQGPRAYLRQQAGYGEAEALLRFKHPDKFNGRGDGIWHGVMYNPAARGLHLGSSIIYSGTFATGLFQCIYQSPSAYWVLLPTTLEWHCGAAVLALSALVWSPVWLGVAVMLLLSILTALAQAVQAPLPAKHHSLVARLVIFGLSYAQPLVRSWHRYRARLIWAEPPGKVAELNLPSSNRMPWHGRRVLTFWTDEGRDRTELLNEVSRHLAKYRWGNQIDSGWSMRDLQIDGYPGTVIQVKTVQENHGGDKRLIRVGFRLRPRPFVGTLWGTLLAAPIAFAGATPWLLAVSACGAGALAVNWWNATRLGGQTVALFERVAGEMGLTAVVAEKESAGDKA